MIISSTFKRYLSNYLDNFSEYFFDNPRKSNCGPICPLLYYLEYSSGLGTLANAHRVHRVKRELCMFTRGYFTYLNI